MKESRLNRIFLNLFRKTIGMVFLLFGRIILVVFILFWTSSAHAEYFTIERFHSEIKINENSSIEVTETIEVEFISRRHGIFREVPFRYQTELGQTLIMPFTVISVTREDGSPWQFLTAKSGNVVNIRIGDPNEFVNGRQVYVINYQVENALLFFDEHDELYWNVTGNHWQTDIKSASANIRLSTENKNLEIRCACYTGRYGSSASDCTYEIVENGARFHAQRDFASWQGFTVVMGWRKGVVIPPTDWQKKVWKYNLRENWVFLFPLGVFILMLVHWFRRGRDPRTSDPVVVLYEPPKAGGKRLSPAHVGTLVDEKLHSRDLIATIIDLAGRGYLEIREINPARIEFGAAVSDHKLIKLKEADGNLNRYESTLFVNIFPGSRATCDISDLRNEFYKIVSKLRNLVFEDLVGFGFYSLKPENVKRRYATLGIIVSILGFLAVFFFSKENPVKGVAAAFLSGLAIIVFSGIMPARTKLGASVRKQIKGFQEFMHRADRDKIERLGAKAYYEFLPYAIALGVVDSWTESFKGLLTEPPKWYVISGKSTGFDAGSFSKSMSTATSSLGSAMFAAPRGSGLHSSGGSGFSGGGGGGSSGGGGGGGGGGSW